MPLKVVQAVRKLQESNSLDENLIKVEKFMSVVHTNLANIHSKLEKWEKVVHHCEQVKKRIPTFLVNFFGKLTTVIDI